MRPSCYVNFSKTGKIEVESALVHIGNAVDVKAHGGLVHTGAYTAYVYGRGGPASVVGVVQVGHQSRQAFNVVDLQLLHLHLAYTRCGRGAGREWLLLFLCGNLDREFLESGGFYYVCLVLCVGANRGGNQQQVC